MRALFFKNHILYFLTSSFGSKLITNITAAKKTSRYKATCFSGHSPPLHIENIKKFLNAQARFTAPKKTLTLLAQILWTKKQMIMMVLRNPCDLIWLPKFNSILAFPLIPVKKTCSEGIYTHGMVQTITKAIPAAIPIY